MLRPRSQGATRETCCPHNYLWDTGMNGELQASVRTAMGKSKVFCGTSDTSRELDREIDSTRVKERLLTQLLPTFWLTQLKLRPDVCWEWHH